MAISNLTRRLSASVVLVSIFGAAGTCATAQPAATTPPSTPPASTPPAAPAPAPAPADVTLVVVSAPEVLLRCGEAQAFYAVASLKSGIILQSDGEANGYVRVYYPAGTRAFIKADELVLDASGKAGKTSKPSKLLAANAAVGPRASWNPLLERELAPGTELTVIDTVKADDGKVTHYAVTAPAAARGYVDRQAIRKATPEEVEAFNKSRGIPAAPPAAAPAAPAPAPSTPAAKPTTTPGAAAPAVPPDPLAPPTPATPSPGAAGTTPPMPTPGAATPAPGAPGAETTPPPAPPTPPAPPKPAPTEALVAMYNKVRAEPIMEAELEAAIAQVDAYKATLGSGSAEKRLSERLTRMSDALKLRMEIREEMRRNQDADKELAAKRAAFGQQIAEFEKQRLYQILGRLVPSTVYDGTRLPLLYRVQSPEPGTSRTLGYLLPDEKLDLRAKLGQVVGINGDSAYDDTLKATLITPRKVDVVSLAPVKVIEQAPPANPAPSTPDVNK